MVTQTEMKSFVYQRNFNVARQKRDYWFLVFRRYAHRLFGLKVIINFANVLP